MKDLLREVNLLGYLMHAATTAFLLQRHLKSVQKAAGNMAEANLPPVVDNCCVLLYDLLLACIHSNEMAAVVTLTYSGSLLHMV